MLEESKLQVKKVRVRVMSEKMKKSSLFIHQFNWIPSNTVVLNFLR